MRTFIYYVQRATCGALGYLVFHQFTLGLRLLNVRGGMMQATEAILETLSLPGRWLLGFFDATRPLHMPVPLAMFFLNILFYFVSVWLICFVYNRLTQKTFLGPRRDPFVLRPREE